MMKFADYAPIIFISAKSGQRVTKLLELARQAYEERKQAHIDVGAESLL